MRWLSPPDSVADAREHVRYSSPTFLRNPSRSLISLRIRPAISRCFRVSLSGSASNQSTAAAIESGLASQADSARRADSFATPGNDGATRRLSARYALISSG